VRRPLLSALLVLLPLAVVVLLAIAPWARNPVSRRGVDPVATSGYLEELRLEPFLLRGCNYASPDLDPARVALQLGRSPVELEPDRDFDFERLARVEERLDGIDRHQALEALFALITEGATTASERHLRVADFVSGALCHTNLNPVYPDGTSVYDPLVLLELGQGRCEEAARVAVDLWEAGGLDARLVLLGEHIVAELFYDGGWHFIDPDVFGKGQSLLLDGAVPSLARLSQSPLLIDEPAAFLEPKHGGRLPEHSPNYPSRKYFGATEHTKRYREKGPVSDPARDVWFGWKDSRRNDTLARDILTSELPPRFQPGAPRIRSVAIRPQGDEEAHLVEVTWSPSIDRADDLVGYRVYVATRSRGWSYSRDGMDEELLPYLSHPGGWEPAMNDRLYELPPSDVERITTPAERIPLVLSNGRNYFLTIMPFDEHGERVGKVLYRCSHELVIQL